MKKFPYSKQKIFERDILAVRKVLKSKFITQGPIVKNLRIQFQNLYEVNMQATN